MSKSKVQTKRIAGLIAGAVVILLLVGLIVFLLADPAGEADTDIASNTDSTVTYPVISEDKALLESIRIQNAADDYTIVDTGGAIFRVEGQETFAANESQYESILATAVRVMASHIVAENCENLSDFGFDEPTALMKVKFTNGNIRSITLGGLSSDGRYRYVVKTGETTVYAVLQSILSDLELTRADYLDTSLIPSFTDEEGNAVVPTVHSFRVEQAGKEKPLVLEEVSNERLMELGMGSEHSVRLSLMMTSPVYALTNTTVYPTGSETSQYDPVYDNFGLSADEAVAVHPTAAELTAMGFDKPTAVLEMTYDTASTVKLTAGAGLDADRNITTASNSIRYYYLMKEGTDAVYLVSKDKISWVDLEPKLLMMELVTLPMVSDVDSIEFYFDGNDAVEILDVTTEWSESADENSEKVSENTFTFNGVSVLNNNAIQLYQLAMNPGVKDINSGRIPTGKPKTSVVFRLESGEQIRVDVYVEDDLTTIISLNGNNAYIGRFGYVDKLKRELQNIREHGSEEAAVQADW